MIHKALIPIKGIDYESDSELTSLGGKGADLNDISLPELKVSDFSNTEKYKIKNPTKKKYRFKKKTHR